MPSSYHPGVSIVHGVTQSGSPAHPPSVSASTSTGGYVGIANVRNQAGKSLVVRIDFAPERVKDVAAAERDAALAAPLDGRCVL